MPFLIPVAIAAIGVTSAIIASGQKNDAEERARSIQSDQAQAWLKIRIPDPEERKLALQQFVQTGNFTPALESAIKLEQTNFEKIKTSPVYKQAQNDALSKLQEMGTGALTLTDKMVLNEAQNSAAVDARARNQQVTDQMARRGELNSGFSLAAQLQGNQAANDMESKAGMAAAAQAQNRALNSIIAAGNMGTSLRNQEYGEQRDLAAQQDAIDKFNAVNTQNVQNRNIESQNAAQKYNLGVSQAISDKNTALANQQQIANKQAQRDYMNDQMRQLQGASGHYDKIADSDIRTGNNNAAETAGIGQGVMGGLGAAGGMMGGASTPTVSQAGPDAYSGRLTSGTSTIGPNLEGEQDVDLEELDRQRRGLA